MNRLTVLATALLLSACGHAPPPLIPVAGSPADLAALAGEWSGEYHADAVGGREGTILFRLEAGEDEATGDVLMHVEGRDAVDALPLQGDPWADVPHDRILTVTFVRASGGMIFGRLHPYPDPVCGCELRTTFSGRLSGDAIRGMYTITHVHGGATVTGSWRVTRRKAPAG